MNTQQPALADAKRRAHAIKYARTPQMKDALVKRVLFDLRASLKNHQSKG